MGFGRGKSGFGSKVVVAWTEGPWPPEVVVEAMEPRGGRKKNLKRQTLNLMGLKMTGKVDGVRGCWRSELGRRKKKMVAAELEG